MDYKVLSILVVLVSWSTLLYADSLGCGGYPQDVSKSDYRDLIPEIQRRCKRTFSSDDITCFKVSSGGYDKSYCVLLNIPGDYGRTTQCTVKWGTSGTTGSSSICTSNGAAVVTGGSGNTRTRVGSGGNDWTRAGGGGNARVRIGHGSENDGLGDAIRNKVRQKISEKFAKHGLPFENGFPFGK